MSDPGELQVPANANELRDTFLTDIRLAAIDAGLAEPPTHPGTDWWLLGTAVGNCGLIHWGNVAVASNNSDILNATGRALEDIRIAEGLPEVAPTGSTGNVKIAMTGGSATITNGQQITLPNGLRAQVDGTHVGVTDGTEIAVVAIDTGTGTNWPGGTKVRFVTPPIGVKTDATVSIGKPLTGGTDAESDERKRLRILNQRRYKPAGGNWSHYRKTVLDAVGGISDCFVYPALGGPASVKVVPVKAVDPANQDWTRAPAAALITAATNAIRAEMGGQVEVVVQAPAEVAHSATLRVTIPPAIGAGGNGTGWVDADPWPALVVADANAVTVSAVTSATNITVTANTATSPVANQTHISWWSIGDKKFRTFLVTAVSGTAGAWALTLDKPAVDSTGTTIAANDLICPAAVNIDAYGETWGRFVGGLGPTENTNNANIIPRALRMPALADESPCDPGLGALTVLNLAHPEITAAAFGVNSLQGLPATVAAAPLIFRLGTFAIYET